MKKTSLLITTASLFVAASSLHAASGIFGTGVVINNNGTQTLYEATLLGDTRQAPTNFSPTLNSTGFDVVNLGSFNTTTGDTLVLQGGSVLTFKNGLSDVTSGSVFYRINGGSFTEIALAFDQDNVDGATGDQRWADADETIDMLSGLSNGTHTIAVYFEAGSSDGLQTENFSGDNFTADFTVVPEPGSYALIAGILGLAFVALKRRIA